MQGPRGQPPGRDWLPQLKTLLSQRANIGFGVHFPVVVMPFLKAVPSPIQDRFCSLGKGTRDRCMDQHDSRRPNPSLNQEPCLLSATSLDEPIPSLKDKCLE